jgi:hypothetical protein
MASDMRKSRDLNSDTVDSKVRLLMMRPEPAARSASFWRSARTRPVPRTRATRPRPRRSGESGTSPFSSCGGMKVRVLRSAGLRKEAKLCPKLVEITFEPDSAHSSRSHRAKRRPSHGEGQRPYPSGHHECHGTSPPTWRSSKAPFVLARGRCGRNLAAAKTRADVDTEQVVGAIGPVPGQSTDELQEASFHSGCMASRVTSSVVRG